jgi:hypothetical protein
MSYGRAGVAFTIAAIILLSGLYMRSSFNNPAPQAIEYYDSYYYKDFQTQSFGIAPRTTTLKTFEATQNQKLSLNLNIGDNIPPSQSSSTVRTVINVTDSKGERLLYDTNVGSTYSIQPLLVRNNGTVTVAVTSEEDDALSVTMSLRQSSPPPTAGIFDNAIVAFSNWLMIISTPIFGLGVWLVISERRKRTRSVAAASGENPANI